MIYQSRHLQRLVSPEEEVLRTETLGYELHQCFPSSEAIEIHGFGVGAEEAGVAGVEDDFALPLPSSICTTVTRT